MTCNAIAPLIEPYLDDALDPARQAALRRHLESCAACRRELAELEDIRRLLREEVEAVAERQDAADLWRRIETAVRTPVAQIPPEGERLGIRTWLARLGGQAAPRWALASALALLLVTGGMWYRFGLFEQGPALPPNACIVSSVESNNLVLVLPGEQGQPTVIWVYDQPKENGA